jgi:two-component system phosphate regulon response regulator OmpR
LKGFYQFVFFNWQHLQIRQTAVLSLHKLDLTGPAGTVRITATEATLLQAFAQSPDTRLDFAQVAQCMGIAMTEEQKSNIQVRMVRLRKKLHEAGAQGAVIESIRNVGYQFFDELAVRKA